MKIIATPLTAAAFARFGQVIEHPSDVGRIYLDETLSNARSSANVSISLVRSRPLATTELVVTKLERHKYSSQSFLPMNVSRHLVIVAECSSSNGPDQTRLHAFVGKRCTDPTCIGRLTAPKIGGYDARSF
jgi:ureidoglycolate lyase